MAVELKPLTLAELPLLQAQVKTLQNGDCNLSIASLIGRAEEYKIRWALVNGELVLNWQPYEDVPPAYVLPLFSPNIAEIMRALESECIHCKEPLILFGRFTYLTEKISEVMRYRNFITVSSNSWWDYLYDRETFVTLEGRELHGKRNFNKRFYKSHPEAQFELITQENIPLCQKFLNTWYENYGKLTEGLKAERQAIALAFEHYDEFGLFGGLLREGDQIFGFTYGSQVADDIFSVHIEKADRNTVGAYPALASSLAKALPEKFTYVNREEDLGIAGLRKAKEDWFPSGMVRKTVLKVQKDTSASQL